MTSGGSLWGNPFLYHSSVFQLGVAISIYHPNRLNWLNWPRRVFTPLLSDYWAELHWVAIPSQRAMSQLLSFSPPRRLQHWAADAVACSTAAPETLVFLHRGSFLCSHALFCPAYHLSPFLSKDIHQRNMAPPSLVTPAALCQLSEWRLLLLLEGGGGGGEVTDNAHLSPSKLYVTFPERFTQYSTCEASASWLPIRMFTIHIRRELVSHYLLHTWLIVTSTSLFRLILFPRPGQLFMKADWSKGLTLEIEQE